MRFQQAQGFACSNHDLLLSLLNSDYGDTMRILLTNDDGIQSDGLFALIDAIND